MITSSAPPGAELEGARDVHDTFFVVRPDRAALDEIAGLVDTGVVVSSVAATYDLADAGEACARRGRGAGPGKTVLLVR